MNLTREVLPGRIGDLPVRLIRERLAIKVGERSAASTEERTHTHTELILGGLTVEGSMSSSRDSGIEIDCEEIPGPTSLYFPAKEPKHAAALASAYDDCGTIDLGKLQRLMREGRLGQPNNLREVFSENKVPFVPDRKEH